MEQFQTVQSKRNRKPQSSKHAAAVQEIKQKDDNANGALPALSDSNNEIAKSKFILYPKTIKIERAVHKDELRSIFPNTNHPVFIDAFVPLSTNKDIERYIQEASDWVTCWKQKKRAEEVIIEIMKYIIFIQTTKKQYKGDMPPHVSRNLDFAHE